jgi:hypothetical protein
MLFKISFLGVSNIKTTIEIQFCMNKIYRINLYAVHDSKMDFSLVKE